MKAVLLVGLLVGTASAAPQQEWHYRENERQVPQHPQLRPPQVHLEPGRPIAPLVQQPAAPQAPIAPQAGAQAPIAPPIPGPAGPELTANTPVGPHGIPVVLPDGVTFGPEGPSEEDEERFGWWGPNFGWGHAWGVWGRRR